MNILVNYKRSTSDPNRPFIPEGKTEPQVFDNVLLIFAEVDRYGRGILLPKSDTDNVAKIRYSDFEEMVGCSFEDFEKNFLSFFFGKEISVQYERRWDKFVVTGVDILDTSYVTATDSYVEEVQKNLERLAAKNTK